MKKIILCFIFTLMMIMPITLVTGCDSTVKDVKLMNGNYKISTYSIDGVSQADYVGEIASINDGIIVDWTGLTATYEIKENNITVTYKQLGSVTDLQGTITETSIKFDVQMNESNVVIVLNYIQDVVLPNGTYVITMHSLNGLIQTDNIGDIYTLNDGIFTINDLGAGIYEVKCDCIIFTFIAYKQTEQTKGTITSNKITIKEKIGDDNYLIVLEKQN